MAEEDLSSPDIESRAGLLSDDILSRVYEGGFKTWECSLDLANYLSTSMITGELVLQGTDIHIIELGAGTALPTATLLQYLVSKAQYSSSTTTTRTYITLADYNAQVLALATIPNLLLTFLSVLHVSQPWLEQGDLDISPASIASFAASFQDLDIHISAVSGAWGSAFAGLLSNGNINSRGNDGNVAATENLTLTLLLASETIYSPASIRTFTHTILALLRAKSARPAHRAIALVAAKRIYFGVGGGVDEFLAVLAEMGGHGRCVWDSSEVQGEGYGVGRCILEVGLQSVG